MRAARRENDDWSYPSATAMRLFVAVELNDDLRRAAARVIDELRQRIDRLAPLARVTWVAPERMHLTLQFIGDVDLARKRALEEALAPPLDLAPFDVQVAGTGVFPDANRPHIVWAGIAAGGERLAALYRTVSERLTGAGVPSDGRPYRPHLTLGRVRDAAGRRGGPWLAGLEAVDIGTAQVRETVLFESRPTQHGHEYTVRQRTLLRA